MSNAVIDNFIFFFSNDDKKNIICCLIFVLFYQLKSHQNCPYQKVMLQMIIFLFISQFLSEFQELLDTEVNSLRETEIFFLYY